MDLAPEAAARDEHEALDAFRELVAELHRHAAAERVPDDRRALVPEREQQVADHARERAEREVGRRLVRGAVTEQVRRDHRVVAGEPVEDVAPALGAGGDAVDQDQRRALAEHAVGDRVPVKLDGVHGVGAVAVRAIVRCYTARCHM